MAETLARNVDLNNATCDKCGLCKTRKQVVNGVGPLNAKILIVGEAPGPLENERGEPFVGPAGRKLDSMLAQAGIPRNQVFRTNVARCFPKAPEPQSFREPYWEEMMACLPYLDQEIAAIKPNVIVPVGNIALRAVLQNKKVNISKFRGLEVWSEKYKCKIMPTFHPSAVMRSPKYEETVVQDFARIRASAEYPEMTVHNSGNYVIVDTLEKFDAFVERILTVPAFSFDIETSGFEWAKDHILCVSFSWKSGTACLVPITKWIGVPREVVETVEKKVRKRINKQWVFEPKIVESRSTVIDDTYHPYWGDQQAYVLEKLKTVFASDVGKITHNGKFDSKFFMHLGFVVNNLYFDTMLAHHLLNENAEGMHGLKDCALVYTDMGDYDREIEQWFKENRVPASKRNYARVPTEILYPYSCKDSDCTFRLAEIFEPKLREEGLKDLFDRLVMVLNDNLLHAEFEGIKIDLERLATLKIELEKEIADREIEIRKAITKATGVDAKDFNLDSPLQLRKLLFTDLKLEEFKKTAGKNPVASTDEESLSFLAEKYDADQPALTEMYLIPKMLLDYRKAGKLYTTYVMGIAELLDKNQRLHTTFLIHGTTTGRLSSRDPNLQNIPKDDTRIKDLFVAEDGWELIEADYGQAEFRFWASYSKDPQMLQDLRNGLDIHRLTAAQVARIKPEEVDDIMRGQAKRIVFGLMYGMGPKKLARQNKCSEAHALNVISIFFSKYPTAKMWLRAIVDQAKRQGQVRSCFGRIRRLPGINDPDLKIRAESERQAMNSPIQSAASDLTCNAANRIVAKFQELGMKGRLRLLIHDAILLEVPRAELQKAVEILNSEMTRPVPGVVAPMICDIKTGTRWGSMKKWK